jgi:hypothetical protein
MSGYYTIVAKGSQTYKVGVGRRLELLLGRANDMLVCALSVPVRFTMHCISFSTSRLSIPYHADVQVQGV